ncbi:MAG: DUF4348 domain-containing protein [Bacteroidaceae bacterium]|nr:DUF4348 domain-containing protein [Bacteroidaceae bacterium]
MKTRLLSILMLAAAVASMPSCHGSADADDSDEAVDSIPDDSLGLEPLDLFEEEVIPKSVDELFDDFLYSYITNQDFMHQRTMRGIHPLMLGDDQPLMVIYEREEDLELQKDTAVTEVVVEQIDWSNDAILMYKFGKNSGRWMLNQVTDNEISNTPNASFLVFLRDFLADSLYRSESIQLPLIMRYYSDEDETEVESEMTADDWNALFADLPDMSQQIVNVDYGQSLFSKNRKSIQLQELSNGLFMKFHFDFTDGRWRLIEIEG